MIIVNNEICISTIGDFIKHFDDRFLSPDEKERTSNDVNDLNIDSQFFKLGVEYDIYRGHYYVDQK